LQRATSQGWEAPIRCPHATDASQILQPNDLARFMTNKPAVLNPPRHDETDHFIVLDDENMRPYRLDI
jgi:hypothetical protein